MNSRIVIAVYKPLPGKAKDLEQVVRKHTVILREENLVTDRKPIIMKAQDGSVVEIFEWNSPDAIQSAHTNPVVLKLWEEFNAVCSYQKPSDVQEFHNLFSEFEPIQF
jgi:hypothetical protein